MINDAQRKMDKARHQINPPRRMSPAADGPARQGIGNALGEIQQILRAAGQRIEEELQSGHDRRSVCG